METCVLCGKMFNSITHNHVMKNHGISYKEYKQKYMNTNNINLNAEIYDDNIINRTKETNSKINETTTPAKDYLIRLDSEIYDNNIVNMTKEINPKIEEIAESSKDFLIQLNDILKYKNTEYKDPRNITTPEKVAIMSYLMSVFSYVENNYFIEKWTLNKFLAYRYVTDISIPSLQIDIEFPNAFWHNSDVPSSVRDNVLKKDGWTIIKIMSVNPCVDDVQKELLRLKLI